MKSKLLITAALLAFLTSGCKADGTRETVSVNSAVSETESAVDSQKVSSAASSDSRSGSESHEPRTSTTDEFRYHVTFKNYDETDLYTAEVLPGETAVYVGDTPIKPATAKDEYVFTGWDRELDNIQENFTTYAQYRTDIRRYEIEFRNYDGSTLQKTRVAYGEMPSYTGSTPIKNPDTKAVYTFVGWDKEINYVTKDEVYTAVYDSEYAPTYRTPGLIYQVVGNNEYYSVIGYFGNATDVAIPQTFDGLEVRSIREGAFANNDKLENIFIPKTVTEIEANAFLKCPSIKHLSIGKGNPVYFIDGNGDLAKKNCLVYSLPSHTGLFTVDEDYTSVLPGAFSESGISGLVLNTDYFETLPKLFGAEGKDMPASFRTFIQKGGDIQNRQFMDCQYLESFAMIGPESQSPKVVGDDAFRGCTSLDSLVFDNNLSWIGDNAFRGCTSLTRLQLGTDENFRLDNLGKGAFDDLPNLEYYQDSSRRGYHYLGNPSCQELILISKPDHLPDTSYLMIPKNTIAIYDNALAGMTNITDIELGGDRLTYIGSKAFADCVNLETLNFHAFADDDYTKNIERIPYDAFEGCTKLQSKTVITDDDSGSDLYLMKADQTSQEISKSLLGIDLHAFSNRISTTDLTFDGQNQRFKRKDGVLKDTADNIIFADLGTAGTVDTEGEAVYDGAFYGQSIRTLHLNEGLKIIGSYAFSNTTLPDTKVMLPESLEVLGSYAFRQAQNVDDPKAEMSYYSGNRLTTIGTGAFYNNSCYVRFYTPFTEAQPGWASDFNSTYTSVTIRYGYQG